MKKNKNYSLVLLFTAMVASLSACVKNREGETSFSGLKPIIQIPEGGLKNFGAGALTFPGTDASDTAWFRINYASTNVASKDVVVKLAFDANAMAAINQNLAPSDQYAKFPDSTYKFTTTQVTVKAGQSYSALVPFVVYPSKLDPTKSYMYPITITDASGNTISGNFGTIYFHVIGNPIAGVYNWDWTRWNNATGTGSPTASSFTGRANIFAPDNSTTIEVPGGYLGVRYVLSFTKTGGVLSNFQLSLNPDDVKGTFVPSNISVTDGPTILIADPVNRIYKFHYSVVFGSASRYLIDKYYR